MLDSPSARPRHAVALILAAACWGTGTAISKQAVAEVPPLTLLPVQLAVSVLFLLGAAIASGQPLGNTGGPLTRLGILNPGIAYALGLLGLTQITASLSVLLWAAEPLLILLLAAWLLRERVAPVVVVLSSVALAGMILVLHEPAVSGALAGIVLTLAGVACCAVYTVAARRWLSAAGSTLGVVVGQQAYALSFSVVLLALVAGAGATVLPSGLTLGGAASVVGSGVMYYGLAYWLYLSGLRHVPASIAAMSFYLIPVFGLAAATALGDRLEPSQWIGAALVVVAVAAIGRPGLRDLPSRDAP